MMLDVNHRRGERVKIATDTVRGIWYTETGQRVEQWLPAGEYQIEGVCSLADGDALCVFRPKALPVHVFYVHPSRV